MFSFENGEFQRIYEDWQQSSYKKNKDRLQEKLEWFCECVEHLTVDEVVFVLSLRCCDHSFRCIALRTLQKYVRDREQFLEMMGELGAKEVERRKKRKRL